MLELRDLVKHYRTGSEVVRPVDGISWQISAGSVAALYGPSGSGKSTLLSIIAADLEADCGEVLVDGVDVTRLEGRDADRYRLEDLGYVAQSDGLIEGTSAIDNAALKLMLLRVPLREAHARVAPLLDAVGLRDRHKHTPEQLSVGERQRVAIARALAADPKLLLADEPTGALDAARSRDILDLLAGVCADRGVALLLATHDAQAAAYARDVRELRDGQLHEYAPQPHPVAR